MMQGAVERFKRNLKLDEATSDDEGVAPVYLLDELARITERLTENGLDDVARHLVKKLEHKSPIVKQKALRVIKHLCMKGARSFRRVMNRRHYSKPVRELLHFRGVPDPLRGDSLNQKVRDTAKEAVDAIFDQSSNSEVNMNHQVAHGRIEGFGGGQAVEEPPAWANEYNSKSETRMEGFGSSSDQHEYGTRRSGSGLSSGLNMIRDWGSSLKSSQVSTWKTGASLTSQAYSDEPSVGTSYRPYHESSNPREAVPPPSTYATEGVLEKQLVDSICAPGGVRLEPTPEAMRKFHASLNRLDRAGVEHVLEALDIKVTNPSHVVVYRALCAIEDALGSESKHADLFSLHYTEYPELILQHNHSKNKNLKELSQGLARKLGLKEGNGLQEHGQTLADSAEEVNLMGGFFEDEKNESKDEDEMKDLLCLNDPGLDHGVKKVGSKESVTSLPHGSQQDLTPTSHEIADLLGQLNTGHEVTSSEEPKCNVFQGSSHPSGVVLQPTRLEAAASSPVPGPQPSMQPYPQLYTPQGAQSAVPGLDPGMLPFPSVPVQPAGAFVAPPMAGVYPGMPQVTNPGMMSQSSLGMQFYQQSTPAYTAQASYTQGYQYYAQPPAPYQAQMARSTGMPQSQTSPIRTSNMSGGKSDSRKSGDIPEFDFITQHISGEIKKG